MESSVRRNVFEEDQHFPRIRDELYSIKLDVARDRVQGKEDTRREPNRVESAMRVRNGAVIDLVVVRD